MDLELKDIIHSGFAFLGAFVAITFRIPSEKRRHKWMSESVAKVAANSNQLTEHAKWAHKGIRLIAEERGINLDTAPSVEPIVIESPPPYELSLEEITKSGGIPRPGGSKKKRE